MSRKWMSLFSILVVLSMVLAACQSTATTEAPTTAPTEAMAEPTEAMAEPTEAMAEPTEALAAPTEGGGTPAAAAPAGGEAQAAEPVGYGTIVQRILDRGKVICGGRTDLAGFGYLDDAGRNIGFDIDVCRAVAAVLLGDPEAVEVVPLSAAERGPALQTGEVDILSRNATWTSTRDAQWGNFTWIMFYDGQGFIVPVDSGIETIEDLNGATVCVTSGTTTELNLADAFRQRGLEFTPVTFEDTASVYSTYEDGRCDAATSDKSQLAAVRSGFADPAAHKILPITISKEPLTPAVPSGDDKWFDIVKVTLFGLIDAEELGVTQANVGDMATSDNVEVRRLVGAEGDWGQADLGLAPDAMVTAIKAVGNYGEIYDRYMGPNGDAFTLDRDLNNLWTNGGLMYAPPLR
jgi:general L-amino acid transport system substrate-binding protein